MECTLQALLIIAISMLLLYALMVPYLLRFSKQIVSLDKALKQVARGNLDVSTDLTGALELTNISYSLDFDPEQLGISEVV